MAGKLCKYCNESRDESEFGVALSTERKVYRRLKCKFCKQKMQTLRQKRHAEWLLQYKLANPCIRCGYSDPRALTFHHRDRRFKDFNVSEMLGWSIKSIQQEIAKCDVLCANCHLIIEAEYRGV